MASDRDVIDQLINEARSLLGTPGLSASSRANLQHMANSSTGTVPDGDISALKSKFEGWMTTAKNEANN